MEGRHVWDIRREEDSSRREGLLGAPCPRQNDTFIVRPKGCHWKTGSGSVTWFLRHTQELPIAIPLHSPNWLLSYCAHIGSGFSLPRHTGDDCQHLLCPAFLLQVHIQFVIKSYCPYLYYITHLLFSRFPPWLKIQLSFSEASAGACKSSPAFILALLQSIFHGAFSVSLKYKKQPMCYPLLRTLQGVPVTFRKKRVLNKDVRRYRIFPLLPLWAHLSPFSPSSLSSWVTGCLGTCQTPGHIPYLKPPGFLCMEGSFSDLSAHLSPVSAQISPPKGRLPLSPYFKCVKSL